MNSTTFFILFLEVMLLTFLQTEFEEPSPKSLLKQLKICGSIYSKSVPTQTLRVANLKKNDALPRELVLEALRIYLVLCYNSAIPESLTCRLADKMTKKEKKTEIIEILRSLIQPIGNAAVNVMLKVILKITILENE